MAYDAIAVFTGKNEDDIFRSGGSQSWVLDPSNARRCKYGVLYYNPTADWATGAHDHGAAFMVGKIAGVEPSDEEPGRWKMVFSEYATIDGVSAWGHGGHWRNPVRYSTMAELGIDPSKLKFRAMPPREMRAVEGQAMTIADAKRGLAKTYGVSPDAIEIIIRG